MAHLGIPGLRNFHNDPTFSDVTIHFHGQRIKAHKVTLATHSDHFARMFAGGFVEASIRDVHLQEDDEAATRGLIAWCYGLLYDGEVYTPGPEYWAQRPVPEHLEYLVNLYVIADKYFVPPLQQHAENKFKKRMDMIDSATETLVKLDIYEAIGPLLYQKLGDQVSTLRERLAKSVEKAAPRLITNDRFKSLTLEIPELAWDVMGVAFRRSK